MTVITGKIIQIEASASSIYKFLLDLNNLGKIMPEQVINFSATADTCTYTIKGMTDMAMKRASELENSNIVLSDAAGKPFKYTLKQEFKAIGENQSTVQFVLDADLSFTLQMLASKPLENFVNMLTENLKKVIEG